MILECRRTFAGFLHSSWPWKRDATVCEYYALMTITVIVLITGRIARSASCRYYIYSQAENLLFFFGRLVAPIHVKLQGRRTRGSAWLCKISPQSAHGGGNAAQKYGRFPLFGKESPRRDEPFDRFLEFCYGFLYAQLSCISVSNLK